MGIHTVEKHSVNNILWNYLGSEKKTNVPESTSTDSGSTGLEWGLGKYAF